MLTIIVPLHEKLTNGQIDKDKNKLDQIHTKIESE